MLVTGSLIIQLVSAWLGEPEARLFDPGVVRISDGATAAELERFRIQRHLALVEATLRQETSPDLSRAQARARAELLDQLHAYAERGTFPRNGDFPDRRVPYFIDDLGTACAVGHLMIVSGAADLAYAIASDENNDVVADIGHPGVGAWLDANGLSAEDAAWIQPSYGPCGFGEMPLICGSDGNTYLCEYVATECAMVEVAHEGACATETDSETDGGEVIGEEICSGSEESADESGTDGATTTGATEDGDDPEDKSKGCSMGNPGGTGFAFVMLLLAAGRRRRFPRVSTS